MTHLTLDERLELIEEAGEPVHPHLGVCARCRDEVVAARAALAAAGREEVPEPSPLFWEHLSARVAERVAEAPAPSRRSWVPRVFVPLAIGASVLLLAVAVDRHRALDHVPAPSPVQRSEAGTAPDSGAADDEEWAILSHLAGDFDVETLSDSLGTSRAGGAETAVWQLDEHERAELAVLLRAELKQGPAGS